MYAAPQVEHGAAPEPGIDVSHSDPSPQPQPSAPPPPVAAPAPSTPAPAPVIEHSAPQPEHELSARSDRTIPLYRAREQGETPAGAPAAPTGNESPKE